TYKDNKAAVAFSHIFLAASVVIVFLPLLSSLMATYYSWRLAFLVMSVYGAVIAVLCFFFLRETHEPQSHIGLNLSNIFTYYKTIISHRLFLGYVLCSIFMIAGESAFNTASSFLLIKTFDLTKNQFGLFITCLALGHLVGTLLCGRLVKRYDLVSMMGTGVTILALSTVFMTIGVNLGYASVSMIMLPMVIFYVGTGFVMTITAVGAVIPFPQMVGISSAASLLLNFSFSAFSSAVMSHLSTKTAGPVSILIATCGVAAFFAWFFLIVPNKDIKVMEAKLALS
ncbi:MAG: MFS transporter, partial [Gammaproteobacteria bacterium]|nr:MFS transporter [Gammaproteobacteria bacterium]